MSLRIVPGEGRRVRDPATGQLLTKRARDVPDTAFWRRRIADGDVVVEPARAAQTRAAQTRAAQTRPATPAAAKAPAKKDPT